MSKSDETVYIRTQGDQVVINGPAPAAPEAVEGTGPIELNRWVLYVFVGVLVIIIVAGLSSNV